MLLWLGKSSSKSRDCHPGGRCLSPAKELGQRHCQYFPLLFLSLPHSCFTKAITRLQTLGLFSRGKLRILCSISHSWGSRQSKDCPTKMFICVLFLLHTSSIWITMADTSHSFSLAYICVEHTVNQKPKLLKVIL